MVSLPSMHKKYNIKKLQDSHREMCRLLTLGVKRGKVAAILGVTPQTVTNMKTSPVGQEQLGTLQDSRDEAVKDILDDIRTFVKGDGIRIYKELITDEHSPAAVRAKLLVDALNREGSTSGSGEVRIKGAIIHTMLTDEDKREIIERQKAARTIGKDNGNVIEGRGEVVEVSNS